MCRKLGAEWDCQMSTMDMAMSGRDWSKVINFVFYAQIPYTLYNELIKRNRTSGQSVHQSPTSRACSCHFYPSSGPFRYKKPFHASLLEHLAKELWNKKKADPILSKCEQN